MKEINEQQWLEKLEQKKTFAVFVHTSMCGTCNLARQMLDVLMAMDAEQPIYQINIQFMRQLQITYGIESVPCLLLFEEGRLTKRVYAMQSVSYLYEITVPLRKTE